jgi:hypothetical protein
MTEMGSPKGFNIKENVFKRQLDFFCETVTAVMRGDYVAVFCSGPPGIGKTYFIEQIKEKGFRHLEVIKVKLDAVHFVDILYEFRYSNCVLFIDDKQGMLQSEAMQDHLLAALDPGVKKRLVHDNRIPESEGGRGKGTFEIKCRFIIVQNQDIFADNYRPPANVVDKVEALKSRLVYNKCTIPTNPKYDLDLYNYIC